MGPATVAALSFISRFVTLLYSVVFAAPQTFLPGGGAVAMMMPKSLAPETLLNLRIRSEISDSKRLKINLKAVSKYFIFLLLGSKIDFDCG